VFEMSSQISQEQLAKPKRSLGFDIWLNVIFTKDESWA
jgi:predicted Co/Zn/Cd cation transporter (cation efflux family)